MKDRCTCPNTPEISSPTSDPIRCAYCGEPLELTCAKGCAKAANQKAGPPLAGIADIKKSRTYAPKACALCHHDFTPTGPRSLVCDRCKALKSTQNPTETPVNLAGVSGGSEAL